MSWSTMITLWPASKSSHAMAHVYAGRYTHNFCSAGTLADVKGELFIKPCTSTEIDFYQLARQKYKDFVEIMPVFMGTLALSDPTEVTTAVDDIAAITTVIPETIGKSTAAAAPETGDGVTWKPNNDKRIKTDQAIVLGNLTHGYKKPNILDAKLGVRLWADDAPMQKRQRFDTISAETTHSEFGCRIAGMRIYKGSEDPAALDQEGYRVYDRDYGRTVVNNDNFTDEIKRFVFNKTAGIDEALGKAVCQAFAHELRQVEEVFETHHTRMYSSSILFVFEGDGEALEEAIVRNNEMVDEIEANIDEIPGTKIPETIRIDSGIVMDDEDGEGSEDGENGENEVPSLSLPKVCTLKLIDFAHAQWVPGKGPDENTLIGVRNLRRIFEDLAE